MREIERRIIALEHTMRNKTGVGVLMPVNGAWRLHFGEKYTDYATQAGATEAFYKKASPDATLIIWR